MVLFMPSVQQPAVAGTFYSADPEKLSHSLSAYLNSPFAWDIEAKALAVPHAGHVYSGPIAGTAYASVRHLSDRIKRVVLVGPAHRARFKGIALPSADSFATPLGNIPVDWKVLSKAISLPQVTSTSLRPPATTVSKEPVSNTHLRAHETLL